MLKSCSNCKLQTGQIGWRCDNWTSGRDTAWLSHYCDNWTAKDTPKSCDDCKWIETIRTITACFRGSWNYRSIGGGKHVCDSWEESTPKSCSTCVHTTEVDDYVFCDIPIREFPPDTTLSGAGYNCDFWVEKPKRKLCSTCKFVNAGCVACDGWEEGKPVVIVLNECEHEEEDNHRTDLYSKLGRFPCWLVPVDPPQTNCDECANFERKVNRKDCAFHFTMQGEERCGNMNYRSYLCAEDCRHYGKK